MNICFITSDIFTLGGVQRVTSVLANELVKDNKVDILCITDNDTIDRTLYGLDERVNITINGSLNKKNIIEKIIGKIGRTVNNKYGIFNNSKNINFLTNIYFCETIKNNFINYLNSKDYDIIIGVEGYFSLLLGIISKKLNAKTIGWQHNSYDAYLKNKNRYHWNQDQLFKSYINNLDKYVVLTNYDKNKYKEEMGIDVINISNPKSFSSSCKSQLNRKKFLAAGRFNYQKGFDLLIESFYEFSKINDETSLDIVGEGKEKDKIVNLINSYGLEKRIQIHPFTNNIEKYFLESSTLLLPSRWEGMPMIVLEALEMGVPVISYNITAIEPLVEDRIEGIIIEKFDVKAFANAMILISDDENLRCTMGKYAIKKSEKFSPDNIGNQWRELFSII